jgi:hypothetical protein
MATYRGQGTDSYNVGAEPPSVAWTVVRGDTAAFRVYVTDEDRVPLNIPDWNIAMDVVRPSTDALILSLTPEVSVDDDDGEFTVSITSGESEDLETGDIFDIQLSDVSRVWTVCRGTIKVVEDVTGPYES